MTAINENAHFKKRIKTLDVQVHQQSVVINEHAKFINAILAQNKELKQRIEKLEYKRPKLIIT